MSFQLISIASVLKKIQAYACTEKQKESSKLREIASSRPLLLHAGLLV